MPQHPTGTTALTSPTTAPACVDGIVQVKDLTIRFGAATIVRNLNLTVSDGEMVAIAGANGSGKSTLIRALTGIVPATEGSIELFGKPLGRKVPWHRIGYVPQRISAATGIPSTALEVVASGLLSGRTILPGRGWKNRSLEALDVVGLRHRAEQPVHELSGGQQQRVLIARGLVRRPDLLILDEPVAGVDHPSQEKFANTIATLRERGTTVIVVLHELGLLAEYLTRSVVISHGKIVYDGPLRESRPQTHPHADPPEPVLPSHLRHPAEGPGGES